MSSTRNPRYFRSGPALAGVAVGDDVGVDVNSTAVNVRRKKGRKIRC